MHYHNNHGLVISMPSTTPESTHEGLISAIITTIKFGMQSDHPIPPSVKQGNVSLLNLLENLMPDETQLKSIHQKEIN